MEQQIPAATNAPHDLLDVTVNSRNRVGSSPSIRVVTFLVSVASSSNAKYPHKFPAKQRQALRPNTDYPVALDNPPEVAVDVPVRWLARTNDSWDSSDDRERDDH